MKKVILIILGVVVVWTCGCITPVGMYGPNTQQLVSTSDLILESGGNDTLDVTISLDPVTQNVGKGGMKIGVKGVTKITSKGNVWVSRTSGRAKGLRSIFLGDYGSGNAHHVINFSTKEGEGKEVSVPRDVFYHKEK